MHLAIDGIGLLLPAMEGGLEGLQPLGSPAVEEGEVEQPQLKEEGQSEGVLGPGEEEGQGKALGTEGFQQASRGCEAGVKHLKEGQRSAQLGVTNSSPLHIWGHQQLTTPHMGSPTAHHSMYGVTNSSPLHIWGLVYIHQCMQ